MPASTIKELSEQLDEIAKDVAVVRHLLLSEEDPSRGMFFRLAQLERDEMKRTWLSRTAIGASVVALIGVVSKFIFGS